MILGDAVSNLDSDVCMDFEPYFKVHNLVSVHPTGLLIFRAVAEPRISTKSAKSREIHQNTRNPAKFARNLTKYMSAQYI